MSKTSDLRFLQELTEEEFSELVLMPLLSAMGYSEIRYNHGRRELGKDIVFTRLDAIEGPVTTCAVVKMRQLSGSVSNNRGLREIFYQVSQALQEPFIHPQTGAEVAMAKAYIVTPYPVSNDAVASIHGEIKGGESRVSLWDGPALVDRIGNFLPDLLVSIQTPERRLIQSLLLRLTSSRTSRPLSPSKAISLLDVYTAGTISPISREAAALASFANPLDVEKGEEIHDVLHEHPFIVVAADVGAGKTSLLQMLSIQLLRRSLEAGSEEILPLLIPLHRLPIVAFEQEDLLPAIKDYLISEGLPSPDWQSTSRYLLLLDGFDEIPVSYFSGGKAFKVLQKVFPKIVITSRPSRLPDVSDFAFFHLRPFDAQDIQVFLRKWFGGDYEAPKRIHEKIQGDSVLRIFCRTPLMLTLFAILAERLPLGQLPTRRTGVYSEIADLLLGKWDELRGVQNVYTTDLKSFALEDIAFGLQERGERRFAEPLLETKAREVLGSAAARGAGGSKWLFARELIFRSSLLRPSGKNHLEFSHLSFQEYFAAKKISRSPDRALLLRTMFDDWWRGTWTFFFGMSRTLDDLYLPSQSKLHRSQALGAYLAEADYTSPKKRREVLRLIGYDILNQPRLGENTALYYAAYGYEIIQEMTPEVSRSNFRGNTFNYALLAVLVEDDRAHKALLEDDETLLRRLTEREICLFLKSLALRINSPSSVVVFERSCQLITGIFDHSASGDMSIWEALREIASLIEVAFRRGQRPHDVAVQIQKALYSAGKAARPGWTPEFNEKHLRHWKL
jgi:NACHT domain